jgi:hypothetical protein
MVRATPPSFWKCSHVVSLEALPCSLPVSPTRVYDGDMVCRRWIFFFLSSLFPKNYSLLVFQFKFLFFWFLILSWPFCRIFIYFQFHPSILIYQIWYSPIWLSFLWFQVFYLCLFVWVLLAFNFIIQFKLMVLYFSN